MTLSSEKKEGIKGGKENVCVKTAYGGNRGLGLR